MPSFLNSRPKSLLQKDYAATDALQHESVTDFTRDITSATTRATVFDIPNLVDLITPHLTTRDIYSCTLVSHHFHDAFQQSLYTCIYIHQEANVSMFFRKEAQAAFANHHSQVKEVSTAWGGCIARLVNGIGHPYTLPQGLRSTSVVKNLTVLRYLPTESVHEKDLEIYSTAVLSLMETSPALQVLHISRFAYSHHYHLVQRLMKVIREKGRQLKELRVYSSEMLYAKDFYPLLWSCAAVEVLHMGYGPHPRGPTSSFAETLPGLRAMAREALSVKGTISQHALSEAAEMAEFSQDTDRIKFAWKELGPGIWLINPELEMVRELLPMCPFLERTVFPKLTEQNIITHVAPIVAQSMPRLCHLDLTLLNSQPLATCRLVQSCKDLITLYLGRPQFDPRQLVEALVSGHGHSLESLYIRVFDRLSSQQLNLILSSCRSLKALYASLKEYPPGWNFVEIVPILNTKDMALVPEEPGWQCKVLETLELSYNGRDTTVGIPEVLWRQIGRLSKLRDLRLQRHGTCEGPPFQEKESVRQAVLSWMALSDLRRLELRGLNAFTDEALVSEVRRQRPQLDWVRYTYD
ncbi:hypothetical protein BGZ68_001507 [Mortierella alpina]|nr:hypothetical protein BGZ68_001507 [Mortierella alpina]